MASAKPKIIYFPIRGRAEPIRMALAAAGVDFEFEPVDRKALKEDSEHYPFHQVPRFIDDEVDMVQSMGILRHVARKHGLYGKTAAESARVEEVIEGVNDLVARLFTECAMKLKDDESAAERYWEARVDPASVGAAFGAHVAFLDRLLERGGEAFLVGSGLTVADIVLTTALDIHLELFDRERLAAQWPGLMALHDRVLAVPRIAEYRRGPQFIQAVSPMLARKPAAGGAGGGKAPGADK